MVLPPQEDLHFWGAVIGLVAGPLMLLYVVFARPFHSTRWFVASILVFLIGFGLLVLRQPVTATPTAATTAPASDRRREPPGPEVAGAVRDGPIAVTRPA